MAATSHRRHQELFIHDLWLNVILALSIGDKEQFVLRDSGYRTFRCLCQLVPWHRVCSLTLSFRRSQRESPQPAHHKTPVTIDT